MSFVTFVEDLMSVINLLRVVFKVMFEVTGRASVWMEMNMWCGIHIKRLIPKYNS
jgi:hypothetical protein